MPEKTLTIPLRKAFEKPRRMRAAKAVNILKQQLKKNFRVTGEQIKISNKVNEYIYGKGIEHIPRKIEIKALVEDNIVNAYLKNEKIEKKEKRKPEEKEEKKEAGKETEKEKEIEQKKKEKKEKERAAEKTAIKRRTV